MMSDLLTIQTSLYLLHIALAFCFMIGRGLPFVTLLLWIFQASLRNRNFGISDGGDDLSVILLFISIFLPMTEAENKNENLFTRIWNALWSLVFVVQLLSMYFFSGLKKSDLSWTNSFTASELALRLDNMTSSFGHFLLQFPSLLKFSTALVVGLERIGPIVFLACYFVPLPISSRIKKLLCILFMLFHVAILATFRLWAFPLICISAWVALFPSQTDATTSDHLAPRTGKAFYPFLVVPLVILLTIFDWNLLDVQPGFILSEGIRAVGQQLSLWQNWGMFAPFPTLNNQHLSIIGTKADGSEKDLFDESKWRENRHRVKYLVNISTMDNLYIGGLARYYCRQNPDITQLRIETHNSIINKASFVVNNEERTLWTQDCVSK